MTGRRYLSPTERERILAEQAYLCACGCSRRVGNGEPVEFDHIVPLALGGTNMPDNFRALAPCCHKAKTRKDVREIRKADRAGKKHRGEVKSKHRWPKRRFGRRAKLSVQQDKDDG